jgi:prepilin-type N-terminal cleavage/methylation domain-containing protein
MRHNNIKTSHGCKGMTLVELLVVMAMLSVVMMAVISLYIPVVRSTAAQTQVSDIQSNLRLALKTMTRDLLTAGFLVSNDPIAFPDADPNYTDDNLTNRGTNNSQDFIIRTRVVGDGFARIFNSAVLGSTVELTVTDEEMVDSFPDNSVVRLFESIAGTEIIASSGSNADRAYTVSSSDRATKKIVINRGNLPIPNVILPETIMLRVKNSSQPALQTIRYFFEDGSLKRDINGTVQILARNLSSVTFDYFPTISTERVKRVDIRLTGKTKAVGNDAISAVKTRSVETSVKLRNIH